VDKASKRNGGEIVAQVLHSHGIKQMFCLAGGHISPILAAAEKIGIKVVDTRHEVSICFFNTCLKLILTLSFIIFYVYRFQLFLQLMQLLV
jgi:hypothetical protein